MNPQDHELQKLEQHLAKLSPAQPGEALTARIFSAFETPADVTIPNAPAAANVSEFPTGPTSWSQPFAAAAAVALIAGIVAIIGLSRPPADGVAEVKTSPTPEAVIPGAQPVGFVPTQAQNTYRGSNTDGIIFTDDRRPLQAVRYQYIETYTWENPADGSRVEIRVPIERVRYVPVPTD